MAGLTTGLKETTERGSVKNGSVKRAKTVFPAKKGKEDYHDEMNGARFGERFEEQLLPNLPVNSLIVMDNASYHSVKGEQVPNTTLMSGVNQLE